MTQQAPGTRAPADVLAAVPLEERLILPCLQRIQNFFGYVTDDSVDAVAGFLNVSRAEVIGVLTYYHDLRRTPPPPVVVAVCVAEACQAQGCEDLVQALSRDHSVVPDQATAELLVETVLTAVKVSCTATVEVARGVARRAARRAGCMCYHPEVRGRWWQTPGQVS